MKSVIAAAEPIKKGAKVTDKMLKTVKVPVKNVLPEAISDPAGIVGKYAAADLAAGEVILQNHLQTLQKAENITEKIMENNRAVTLPGGKIETLANMIEPEDRIDIVYTGPSLDGSAAAEVTTVVQENVRVLAAGRRIKTTDAFAEYDTITVEVRQKDAVKLIRASKMGTLNFILQSKHTSEDTKAEGS
ncbi:hypothetical protein AM1BK_02360 [Neobacillus kokaensis]|uniref:SAF domain-containing protein n=2 Tax=Neobacillus kokaensis TaxID=2759023 RepID=A0ABQ3MZK8_9BACI|nr:hypothetical protein AM1BK_02360 [Neobacillus kokaensis]